MTPRDTQRNRHRVTHTYRYANLYRTVYLQLWGTNFCLLRTIYCKGIKGSKCMQTSNSSSSEAIASTKITICRLLLQWAEGWYAKNSFPGIMFSSLTCSLLRPINLPMEKCLIEVRKKLVFILLTKSTKITPDFHYFINITYLKAPLNFLFTW